MPLPQEPDADTVLDRSIFERVFSSFRVNESFDQVAFPDGSGAYLIGWEKEPFTGFMLDFPGGAMFYEALFMFLQAVGACLVIPDDPSVLIATDADWVAPESLETFDIRVVNSGADLLAEIGH